MLHKKCIAEIVVTVCYVGKSKLCPGTFGALMAYPLSYLVIFVMGIDHLVFDEPKLIANIQELFYIMWALLATSSILLLIGLYFTAVYLTYIDEPDPKEVVIDELVGQLLVISCCIFSAFFVQNSSLAKYCNPIVSYLIFVLILPFSLFRLFDIIKPWPINWVDKNIKGAFGVMADDILAAIFAIIAHYTIVFLILDYMQDG